jgi:hypothetical protein
MASHVFEDLQKRKALNNKSLENLEGDEESTIKKTEQQE